LFQWLVAGQEGRCHTEIVEFRTDRFPLNQQLPQNTTAEVRPLNVAVANESQTVHISDIERAICAIRSHRAVVRVREKKVICVPSFASQEFAAPFVPESLATTQNLPPRLDQWPCTVHQSRQHEVIEFGSSRCESWGVQMVSHNGQSKTTLRRIVGGEGRYIEYKPPRGSQPRKAI
jgi:hypothetical protein